MLGGGQAFDDALDAGLALLHRGLQRLGLAGLSFGARPVGGGLVVGDQAGLGQDGQAHGARHAGVGEGDVGHIGAVAAVRRALHAAGLLLDGAGDLQADLGQFAEHAQLALQQGIGGVFGGVGHKNI